MNLKLKSAIIGRFGYQVDFAEHLGVTEAVVSRVVRGRRELSKEDQKRWARILGAEPSDLFR